MLSMWCHSISHRTGQWRWLKLISWQEIFKAAWQMSANFVGCSFPFLFHQFLHWQNIMKLLILKKSISFRVQIKSMINSTSGLYITAKNTTNFRSWSSNICLLYHHVLRKPRSPVWMKQSFGAQNNEETDTEGARNNSRIPLIPLPLRWHVEFLVKTVYRRGRCSGHPSKCWEIIKDRPSCQVSICLSNLGFRGYTNDWLKMLASQVRLWMVYHFPSHWTNMSKENCGAHSWTM